MWKLSRDGIIADNQSYVSSLSDGRTRHQDFLGPEGQVSSLNWEDDDKVSLFGRQSEKTLLHEAFDRVKQENGTSEICFIHGSSGTGKTVLAESLRRPVFESDGYFVIGKYDQLSSANTPFSALVAAFSDLCELVQVSESREQVKADILEAITVSSIRTLCRLVPSLSSLVDIDAEIDEENGIENSLRYIQFKSLCRAFLRAVASSDHPMVLVLDDMQWSDKESIDVLEGMLKEDVSHLLLVCLYRDDEESNQIPLHRFLKETINLETDSSTKVTDLKIAGLPLDSVNGLVSTLLKCSREEALPLSKLVFSRTHGNAYFALRFLEMLESQKLLHKSDDSNAWKWNLNEIQDRTAAAENVVQLITAKVDRASTSIQLVLLYSAYIGFRFNRKLVKLTIEAEIREGTRGNALDSLWQALGPTLKDQNSDSISRIIDASLERCIQLGFIESLGDSRFKFAHDRVQESLVQRIKDNSERQQLHLRIGRVVRCLIDDEQTPTGDWMLFLSVANLNKAAHLLCEEEKKVVAKQNLQAGQLAAAKSAYAQARSLLCKAMDMLNPQSWTTDYELCLHIHEYSAEYEQCTGKYERSCEIVEVIKCNAVCIEDKLKAFQIQVVALRSSGKVTECVDTGIESLRLLGVKLPKLKRANLGIVVVDLIRTRHMLSSWTEEDFEKLPLTDDSVIIAASTIFTHLGLACHLLGEEAKNLLVIGCLRYARFVCRKGMAPGGCVAIGALGMALCILGLYDEGQRYSKFALMLQEKMQAKMVKASTCAATYTMSIHWKEQLYNIRTPMVDGYKGGMEVADVDFALHNLSQVLLFELLYGKPSLPGVSAGARILCKQAEDYGVIGVLPSARALQKTSEYLMGSNEDSSPMLGVELGISEHANEVALQMMNFYRLILGYTFENMSVLKNAMQQTMASIKTTKGLFVTSFIEFYVGMGHYLLAERGRKRYHRFCARQMTKKFKRYAALNLVNTNHLYKLLLLEGAVVSHDEDEIRRAQQVAIDACSESQSQVGNALAFVRAGTGLLMEGKRTEAKASFMDAVSMYEQIEAYGVIEFLGAKHNTLLDL